MSLSIDGTYQTSFGPFPNNTMIDYYIIAVDASEFNNKILEWGNTIIILEPNTTVISFPSIFLVLIIVSIISVMSKKDLYKRFR
jgi:hypothetical protein